MTAGLSGWTNVSKEKKSNHTYFLAQSSLVFSAHEIHCTGSYSAGPLLSCTLQRAIFTGAETILRCHSTLAPHFQYMCRVFDDYPMPPSNIQCLRLRYPCVFPRRTAVSICHVFNISVSANSTCVLRVQEGKLWLRLAHVIISSPVPVSGVSVLTLRWRLRFVHICLLPLLFAPVIIQSIHMGTKKSSSK